MKKILYCIFIIFVFTMAQVDLVFASEPSLKMTEKYIKSMMADTTGCIDLMATDQTAYFSQGGEVRIDTDFRCLDGMPCHSTVTFNARDISSETFTNSHSIVFFCRGTDRCFTETIRSTSRRGTKLFCVGVQSIPNLIRAWDHYRNLLGTKSSDPFQK